MSSIVNEYPSELLSLICFHIYSAGQPPQIPCLDPLVFSQNAIPTSIPSSYPPAHWPQAVVRHTLANLCLLNHAWYEAAKPWLWAKVEVTLPRSWMALVEEIGGGDEDVVDEDQEARLVGRTILEAENAALAAKNLVEGQYDVTLAKELHERLMASLSGPDGHIPPDLLSPPATRDPSPRRLRQKSKSPARWKIMRSINDAVQNVMDQDHPGIYVPTPHDPRPGRFIRHLDFNHFRTIGMRRLVEEGVNNRFVTGDRLQSVLKEMPNLTAFGATEYMDGALTLPVLQELLLRGSPSRGRGRPSRGRDVVVPDPFDPEEEDRERRRECKELQALDLTGCVSGVFVKALTEFVNTHLTSNADAESSSSEDESTRPRSRGRVRFRVQDEPLLFPGPHRLCLRGVKSIQPRILNAFVLAFPSLTHLDLSCTRVTPDLLTALTSSRTIRLRALALERCNWLSGESIRRFLIDAPCTHNIRELSLYGDYTFPSPLSEEDLQDIFAHAPCFRSGELVYLDLSGTPLTKHTLSEVCVSQPALRSLGLSYIRNLPLSAITQFLKTKAMNVEIITMVMTSPELGYGDQHVTTRNAAIVVHAQIIRSLCVPPFSFSLTNPLKPKAKPPTNLRVIELAAPLLTGLGMGAESWRIVKSKGGRGWYVDVASGWSAEVCGDGKEHGSVLRRDLPTGHPWRNELERLSDANGNVNGAVGWHARKMEVLNGHGLLGRESGLYGAVSFAYQG